METIELKLDKISPPVPGTFYQVTKKEYDMGDVIGYGTTIVKAIEDWLNGYELKNDIDKTEIKYKWS